MNTKQPKQHGNASGFSRRGFLGLGGSVVTGAILATKAIAAASKRRVLVWSENTAPREVYPKDINGAIADGLKSLEGWEVLTGSIQDPDLGVPATVLAQTDVLIWWGHKRHGDVPDDLVDRIERRVKEEGMGFIAVHSSHFAKPYKRLMGTACSWREYKVDGSAVKVIVKDPNHPIAQGVKDFTLPQTERYGEPFKVPEPEAVVLDGLYLRPDGSQEPSRQGLCWTIGNGKVFYFQVGHETFPDLFRDDVRQILRNAVVWAAPKRS
jgi:trehalose utilization protein